MTCGTAAEAGEERAPVADAVAGDAHEFDVGGGADEALLEVAAHAVGDGEGDDEGGYAGGYAEDGDRGDDADDGLAAFGPEVTGGDEEFEPHGVSVRGALVSRWFERQIQGFWLRQNDDCRD